ncbi:uncharacterized protein LOC126331442 [Schistocerca gregaria]|uniref:uncharacterized protein LOC126331442 n=1 Tax=Schistocerca gregaria TaxID=7010 RepID=UPI00211EC60F|nr:uncharacterized protein LOC126331442 [Schistocerca gregaria]
MRAVKEGRPVIRRIGAGQSPTELSCEEFKEVLAPYGRAGSGGDVGKACGAEGVLCGEEKLEFLWIDVESPTMEALQVISKCFQIHQLTVEDCMSDAQADQKVEGFGTYRFLSLGELRYVDGASALDRSNIHIIYLLDCPCIITIHDEPVRCLSSVCSMVNDEGFGRPRKGKEGRRQCRRREGPRSWRRLGGVMSRRGWTGRVQARRWSPEWIMYLIIEEVVSSTVWIADANALRIRVLEDTVFMYQPCERSVFLYKILGARRTLARLRTELSGNARLISQIIGQDAWMQRCCESGLEHVHVCFYLRHTLNHILYLIDEFGVSAQTLTNLALAYFTFISVNVRAVSVRQSYFVKIIAAISAIMIPATVTPTLWGMNVNVYLDRQVHSAFGFYLITGVLLASIVVCLLFFKAIHYV